MTLNLWTLPFLCFTPILQHLDNLDQLFLANRALYAIGRSTAIRTFYLHKHLHSVTAALEDILSPESSSSLLHNPSNSAIDAFPLSLLNSETVALKLIQAFVNYGRKDLWEIMLLVSARWGHYSVIPAMFQQTRWRANSDELVQKAVEVSISYAQIEFMTRLLAASEKMAKVPTYLSKAIQLDRPKACAQLLGILRESTPYTKKELTTYLTEAIQGGKFKTLQVLLNDICMLDRESWLSLITLASSKGSHEMTSLLLKTGELIDQGWYIGSDLNTCEMQGWKIAMDSAIVRGKVAMVEYLMNISMEFKSLRVQSLILHHIQLAVQEGQTQILWILLDTPQSITMSSPTELSSSILQYYADRYEKDYKLTLDKDYVKNIRGRDTKGVLPIFRGLISHRKAKFSPSVGRNLLLLAATWNLSATYDFLEENGASLGDSVEPIVECLVRMIHATPHFEVPYSSLLMKLVHHEPTSKKLFEYNDGLLLRTMALPKFSQFLTRRGKPLWEQAVKLTPISIYADVLTRFPRFDEFSFAS